MGGLRILEKRMRFKRNGISKYDLLEIDVFLNGEIKSGLYLAVSVKNDSISVLPLKHYMGGSSSKPSLVPMIQMPYDMIKKYKKLDNSKLLYLIDSGNPHIFDAISNCIGDI